jgi:hypothetical protein
MRLAIAVAGMLLSLQTLACGYCVEDKIAATYDHAVITRALAGGRHVVFFHVDGAAVSRAALEQAASGRGIEKGSARISPDVLTLSVAFDPRRISLVELNALLDRKLAKHKASLLPLRVMERPADLAAVKRQSVYAAEP